VAAAVSQLSEAGIRASLFIDPDPEQLDAACRVGAPVVELHTGTYANAEGHDRANELDRLKKACLLGHQAGLIINAGHGLHLGNVQDIVRLPHMNELNIGHSIIARAIFVGLENAVKEIKALILTSSST
jgi:pyridoxine 5-phosphate synthase